MEDSRGTLCRNRCLFGTLERLRYGWGGKIVKEAKVASEPEALVYFFKELGFPVNRIGFEAGPLSQWLHAGLTQAGFETVLLETRHVKAALSAMTVKTDRKDACGPPRAMAILENYDRCGVAVPLKRRGAEGRI
jgi:hypothetical protein